MRSWALVVFGIILSSLIVSSLIYQHQMRSSPSPAPSASPLTSPFPIPSISVSPAPELSPSPNVNNPDQPDLTADANGLSRATVVLNTSQGIIKFKFYSNDAPQTVKRFVELIQSGFYNGLSFHRVIPKFVIQSGDPTGRGSGGSGEKIKAEFNERKHVEGTIAMARGEDINSADSQFYISLGEHPHLDHKYTVFGQVTEGIDVAKSIKVGDKILSVTIQ